MCEMYSCWPSCIAMGVAWLLIASALLFFAWNKVLVPLFAFKKGKFWQALLLLVTVCVLCLPCASKKHGQCGHGHSGACSTGHCEMEKKGDCCKDHAAGEAHDHGKK